MESDGKMVLNNWEEHESRWQYLILNLYFTVCVEGMRNCKKNLSDEYSSGFPTYEAEQRTTQCRRSVDSNEQTPHFKLHHLFKLSLNAGGKQQLRLGML
jgi:hypothetical protein